ncbi:MAG: MBL fold metallo-hydrolase [Rhodobacteraceae bacterium]|nr:MBL fold metallo-hydrolase [Paracoccaceae bacterium]MCW9042983.1 MBL fold metallo-hydrolase [Pseudopelagicola sp.]
MTRILLALTSVLAFALPAHAETLSVTEVAPDTYAIVGPKEQRSPQNLGNNATFGLVVTSEGAVLIDAGGSHKGAAALHDAIKSVTDADVVYVINTGGQDHRWIANRYWQERGATVIASADAVADQKARASMQQTMLATLLGDALEGTDPAHANVTFDAEYDLTLGGRTLEIRHPGAAHTPGESYVWLPASEVMFTGDLVYVERILGVMEFSSPREWIESFEVMAAHDPKVIVPGHGPATDLATATRDTYDYLVNLRARMADHIDAGGDIIGAVEIDQSAFSYLDQFDQLARRNAQEAFSQMEWE